MFRKRGLGGVEIKENLAIVFDSMSIYRLLKPHKKTQLSHQYFQ
jgi:hypothetical protein